MAPPRFALALLLLLAASGCAARDANHTSGPASVVSEPAGSPPESSGSPASFPVVLTDERGIEVEVAAAPERLVSLAPSNTEIVCALGACDSLVGVTDFDDYPAEVADVPDVVVNAQVDVELVVAAEPDLVLAAGNELTPTVAIEQIEELGIPVVVLYPETLDEVYADVALLGQALGESAAAAELVSDLRGRASAVVEAVAGADRPRVLYEVFHAEGTTYTAGDGSFLASLLDLAGAEPVTGDALGAIATEDLVAADPEVILLGTASYEPSLADPDAAVATVGARPGWSGLAAVRAGAVIPYLDDIVTTRPGPRIVEGLEALARALHPDRFD